ncbi:hypothetical protein AK88_01188 [Plasmodium fragile]|uniref:Plasmodium RESA N-terminal domain-containing protein n=1 Tax=Plasmodium fragile TaxID=5857 RepID=A0A0D9QQQ6_PLAFR|nr:uncharacterized protein AK88_01188 [Plasmodium fragile]KJP89102.1 hypothetical protein AK88_01188 [Plasmodium fragile]
MFSAPRVFFSVFTLMNIVLLNGDLPSQNALSLGGAGLKASRQLAQATLDADEHDAAHDLSNSWDDKDSNEGEQSEVSSDATSSSEKEEQEEDKEVEKEEEKEVEKEVEKEDDHKNSEDNINDDRDDDDDYPGLDIAGLLKEHLFVVPKEKAKLLLDECNRIQVLDSDRAVENLFVELYDLSLKYELTEDQQMDIWSEFLDDITTHVTDMSDYFNDIYEFYMNASTVETVFFVHSLINFLDLWTRNIELIEKNWSALFAEKAAAYKDATPEGMLGKAGTEFTQEAEVSTAASS